MACLRAAALELTEAGSYKRQANFRWFCRDCKSVKAKPQFTRPHRDGVRGFKDPLRHWCFAFWRGSTSKKGVSALEIHRQTGLSYKSCLFLLHRIRFATAPADGNPIDRYRRVR